MKSIPTNFSLPVVATSVIAIILVFATLDNAPGLFAPVLSAIVLGVVLAPFADALERLRVPSSVSAMMILLVFLGLSGAIVLAVGPTINEAIDNAPAIWLEMRSFFDAIRDAVAGVQEMQETVEDALGDGDGSEADEETSAVPIPNFLTALSYGPSVLSGILIFAGTLYFFLATRHDIYARLSRFVPALTESILRRAEVRVSRYFLAISLVNAGFGLAVLVVMSVLGMPQPMMWALATFLLNFLLYLGPAMLATALLLVGVMVFDGPMVVVPMALFLALNIVESQFVTPSVVGRQMAVNPLMIFLSLIFWLWLWGPIGGIVAIPLLVWTRFVLSGGHDVPAPVPAIDPGLVPEPGPAAIDV